MSQWPAVSALALLASQHHESEYNRVKFGPQGCPNRYIPLSLHLPDLFNELQQRQVQAAQLQTWWPCQRDTHAAPTVPSLQEELLAAISDSLVDPPPLQLPPPSLRVKTSSSHPINVSYIVNTELMPLISSHLVFTPLSPTIFDIPPSLALDRLIAVNQPHTSPRAQCLQVPPASPRPSPGLHLRTRSSVIEALHAALSNNLTPPKRKSPLTIPHKLPTPAPSPVQEPPCTGHLFTHSNKSNISLLSTLSISKDFTPAIVLPNAEDSQLDISSEPLPLRDVLPGLEDSWSSLAILQTPENPSRITKYPSPPPSPPLPTFILGNLFLSSCPGKKVRLDGPVRGRGGVCRDLAADLMRFKELGVGCIVCCLDDHELDFLGSPWPAYEKNARQIGIDVLRIPTPEGLAPYTPALVDAHLVKLITRYTLRGTPILVHCRGGVGRAGVMACCWLIKLGLCGWIQEGSGKQPPVDDSGETQDVDPEVIAFVKRVIAVVRKRRSVKAIETYEQVKFLVDYVTYLKSGNGQHLPPDLNLIPVIPQVV
ncbi:phosphatases II [Pluteus cervinus]|uniref:Phosphatases II n=1 Tax=Pluteus cervinus TaxID=181527 RepID=A0ACD3BBB2_9AGAR|nr:phosphatases II [Pluteus cervinus]